MNEQIKNLPEKFIERVKLLVPQDKQEEIFDTFCEKKPVTLRANTLKISADNLELTMKQMQISCTRIPWYSDAFVINDKRDEVMKMLMETSLYKNGYIYIQNLSSMIPALVLDPKPDEIILDIAAAPGSKTTQMAMMMKNSGTIIANDISAARMYKLKSNMNQQGVTNVITMRIPGQFIWKKYPEYFDKVLVDAPCSLEGRFNCYDPQSYKDWTVKKVEILSQRERYLLRSAISATKPGGIIVYSTCTLSPDENEEVIDWVVRKEKTAIAIEQIEIHGIEKTASVMKWRKQTFDEQIKQTLRIFPSKTMEGFFVAKIRKLKSNFN